MYTNGTVPVSDRALRLTGLRMARTHDRTTHKRTTHKKRPPRKKRTTHKRTTRPRFHKRTPYGVCAGGLVCIYSNTGPCGLPIGKKHSRWNTLVDHRKGEIGICKNAANFFDVNE